MKFRQVILARAVRQVATVGVGAPRLDVVNKIKERYQFMKAPANYDEVYPNPLIQMQQGITFLGGRFSYNKVDVAILMMQFLPNLIVVDTHSSTDASDAIIDDYIALVNADHPEAATEMGPRFYTSHLEFTLDREPEMPAEYVEVARTLDRYVDAYGLSVPKYVFWAINLNIDPLKIAGIAPAFFSLERRNNFPATSKVFFSQAPLKTDDHKALLEKLDSTVH